MKKEVKIGLLTIITLSFAIWGYNFLIGRNFLKAEKTFYVIFNNVAELDVSSQVMVNGYPVGAVTSIDLKPENVQEIIVGLTVGNKYRIPKDATAVLKSSSIMGSRLIELEFKEMCKEGNCANSGDYIKGKTLGLIGSMVSPTELDPFVNKIGPSVDIILDKLGDENSEVPINQIIHNANATMENMNSISSQLDRILRSTANNLDKTVANLEKISNTLSETSTQVGTIMDNFETMSNDFKKVSISQTMEKTNGTIDQAGITLKELQSTMVEANGTIKNLSTVISKMDSEDGSLGKLLNDNGLYENLESTSSNLSLLLQDLRLNPKRYVNVSVFGKKGKKYTKPEDDPAYEK